MSSGPSDFIPVARKKRRNRKPQPRPLIDKVRSVLDELNGLGDDAKWAEDAVKILHETIAVLPAPPTRCSCLGLGSPENSEAARVQLALLLYLCDRLNISKCTTMLYDPEFTEEDFALFRELGLQGLREEPDHMADEPSLYYMMHCEMFLYNAVLTANDAHLDRILIVGNRLQDYISNKPTHQLVRDAPTLLRLAPRMSDRVLRPSPSWTVALSCTTVLVVKPDDAAATQGAPHNVAEETDAEASAEEKVDEVDTEAEVPLAEVKGQSSPGDGTIGAVSGAEAVPKPAEANTVDTSQKELIDRMGALGVKDD
ncbi:hypothetical protein BD626DRAFT_509653 [Schizophyllum amplum]|uniref:SRR1-like domain-containing protein n=1 Tax=Schizophyllum amplum TaxID=97359 RepID=A0A550C2P2_9AGAR|nr:hypothetical protein BD626DRAFT_509653 [Auriculariopsis ampla]